MSSATPDDSKDVKRESDEDKLEEIMQDMCRAMEGHDDSPESPDWRHVAPSHRPEMIGRLVRLHEAFPEYGFRILNHTTDIDKSRKKAVAYLNVEVTGAPPGIVRRYTTLMEFQKREGTWLVMKSLSHQGFDPPDVI